MGKSVSHQVVHCGVVVSLKNGKGRCPKCHSEIEADFKVKSPKRSYRKVGVGGPHDKYTMRIGAGLLLLFIAGGLAWNGLSYMWSHGLMTFRMDGFTAIVFIALIGYALVGGFKGKKA